jgi:hypothetical protein
MVVAGRAEPGRRRVRDGCRRRCDRAARRRLMCQAAAAAAAATAAAAGTLRVERRGQHAGADDPVGSGVGRRDGRRAEDRGEGLHHLRLLLHLRAQRSLQHRECHHLCRAEHRSRSRTAIRGHACGRRRGARAGGGGGFAGGHRRGRRQRPYGGRDTAAARPAHECRWSAIRHRLIWGQKGLQPIQAKDGWGGRRRRCGRGYGDGNADDRCEKDTKGGGNGILPGTTQEQRSGQCEQAAATRLRTGGFVRAGHQGGEGAKPCEGRAGPPHAPLSRAISCLARAISS